MGLHLVDDYSSSPTLQTVAKRDAGSSEARSKPRKLAVKSTNKAKR